VGTKWNRSLKISKEDFELIERAMIDTLKAHGLHLFMVQSTNQAWDVFHKAWKEKRLDGHALYERYNDLHFESAFRRMFNQEKEI
jgi:hypothetical protein